MVRHELVQGGDQPVQMFMTEYCINIRSSGSIKLWEVFICKSLILLNRTLMERSRPNFSPKLEPIHRTTPDHDWKIHFTLK